MATEATGAASGERFGVLLRQYRVAAALSQEALAKRAGLSTRAISDLERGIRTRPYLETVRRLAAALSLGPVEQAALATAARATSTPTAPVPMSTPGSSGPIPQGLPVPPTPLIGREREVAELVALLKGDARLVTLTGPGGVGKTRLAQTVAADLGIIFPDGVVWVDLAPLADPALVASTVARAVGVREQAGTPLAETLRAFLSATRLLLVLDNCEHLRGAVGELLSVLLGQGPLLRMLATSRGPLHIMAEHRFPVSPLTLPDPRTHYQIDSVAMADAVRLFVQRGRAARPDFCLTAENATEVANICAQLDGLPLALLLAATRMRSLSPAALLALLDQRLRLLRGGPADIPVRHQTLRATIIWSYDLLTPVQRRLFRELSVFAGGGTLEAVAAVCTDSDPFAALEGLEALLDQSLVLGGERAAGQTRFWMLETIQAFGLEQLEAAGEETTTRERHAMHFLTLAERSAHAFMLDPDQVGVLDRLDPEQDNLRGALTWCVERAPEVALRLAVALSPFWWVRGQSRERAYWLAHALAKGQTASASVRAAALGIAARHAYVRGEADHAVALSEESLALWQTLGDVGTSAPGYAFALLERGAAAYWAGDPIECETFYLRALERFEALGMAQWSGVARGVLGMRWWIEATSMGPKRSLQRHSRLRGRGATPTERRLLSPALPMWPSPVGTLGTQGHSGRRVLPN
jgi:predicted ATPase/DNA-binding XRE family transcriptional regulator